MRLAVGRDGSRRTPWRCRAPPPAGSARRCSCRSGRPAARARNSQPMNSQPSSAIENGLTAQLTNRVTPMPRQCRADLAQRGEVDLEQHRHDHQPDQHRHRQVDAGDLGRADDRGTGPAARGRGRCRRRCTRPPRGSDSGRSHRGPGSRRRRRGAWRRQPPAVSGSRGNTVSAGRHSRTPSLVTTIGRLIRIGCVEHPVDQPVVGQRRVVEPQLVVGRALAGAAGRARAGPCARSATAARRATVASSGIRRCAARSRARGSAPAPGATCRRPGCGRS